MILTDEEIGRVFESHHGNIVDSIRAVIAAYEVKLNRGEFSCKQCGFLKDSKPTWEGQEVTK